MPTFFFFFLFLLLGVSGVVATSTFFGVGNIGSVYHFAYDPVNETFIIPNYDRHQIFVYKIKTNELLPIAGTDGVFGATTNVPGSSALFRYPISIALTYSKHNPRPYGFLVLEYVGHCIRHIDADYPHFVTTVAGNCAIAGVTDGIGNSSRFNSPYNIMLDRDNYRYGVADSANGCIRLITSYMGNYSQPVNTTTIAGVCGNMGSPVDSGNSLTMKLSNPVSIVFIPLSNTVLIIEGATKRILRLVGISTINGGFMSVVYHIYAGTTAGYWYVIPPANRSDIIRVYMTISGATNNVFAANFTYYEIENMGNNGTINYVQLSCTGLNTNMRYTMVLPNATMIQSYTSSTQSMANLENQDCIRTNYDWKLLPPFQGTRTATHAATLTKQQSRSHSSNYSESQSVEKSNSKTNNETWTSALSESSKTPETHHRNVSQSLTVSSTKEETQTPNLTASSSKKETQTQSSSEDKSQSETAFLSTQTKTVKRIVRSHTKTKNAKSRERTLTYKKKEKKVIPVISKNPVVDALGSIVTAITGITTPLMVANIVRFRTINQIISKTGNCKRDSEEDPDISEGPLQLAFPEDSKLKNFIGLVVGNIVFIFAISIVYIAVVFAIHVFKKGDENQREASLHEIHTQCETSLGKEMIYGLFVKKFFVVDVIMMLLGALMTPTFSVGIILAGGDHSDYSCLRGIIVFVIMILTVVYFVMMYSYTFKINKDEIEYKRNSKDTIVENLLKEDGEWEVRGNHNSFMQNDAHISTIIISGYTEKCAFFAFVDCCMVYLMGVPDIITYYVDESISCDVYVWFLTIILAMYLIAICVYRPIHPVLMLYTTIFCTTTQLVICIIKLSTTSEGVIEDLSIALTMTLYLPIITPIVLMIYNNFGATDEEDCTDTPPLLNFNVELAEFFSGSV